MFWLSCFQVLCYVFRFPGYFPVTFFPLSLSFTHVNCFCSTAAPRHQSPITSPQHLVSRFTHSHCAILTLPSMITPQMSSQVLPHSLVNHSTIVLFNHGLVFCTIVIVLFCFVISCHSSSIFLYPAQPCLLFLPFVLFGINLFWFWSLHLGPPSSHQSTDTSMSEKKTCLIFMVFNQVLYTWLVFSLMFGFVFV